MILLPYEQLTIKTSMRAEEARDKLAQVTEPDRLFRWWWQAHKPYEGKVDGYHFRISRIISYRNSFLPYIAGQIEPEMGGCSIRITMHPHILILALTALGAAVGGMIVLLLLESGANAYESFIIAAAIFVIGYGAILAGFKFEAAKSKAFLHQLFQANRSNEAARVNFFRKA